MDILTALEAARDVVPIAEKNGLKIVTFEDQRVLAQADLVNGNDLGNRTVDGRGFPSRSRTPYAAINKDHLFINRYRVVNDTLQVVTDYRAIKEQDTGHVYVSSLPAYTIAREGKALKLGKTVIISDKEFIGEFTKQLNEEAMRKVLPLIAQGDKTTADSLPI